MARFIKCARCGVKNELYMSYPSMDVDIGKIVFICDDCLHEKLEEELEDQLSDREMK